MLNNKVLEQDHERHTVQCATVHECLSWLTSLVIGEGSITKMMLATDQLRIAPWKPI